MAMWKLLLAIGLLSLAALAFDYGYALLMGEPLLGIEWIGGAAAALFLVALLFDYVLYLIRELREGLRDFFGKP